MEDEKIIELFWDRSESAIRETEEKYGGYMRTTAGNILQDEEDRNECINDALLAVWNSIPPARPNMLRTYLGKIVRNIAISRWRMLSAEKRGAGRVALALDELAELSDLGETSERIVESIAVSDILNSFLRTLNKTERVVFIKRYWLFMTDKEIAGAMGLSESNIKVILYRTRCELKRLLLKEGFKP